MKTATAFKAYFESSYTKEDDRSGALKLSQEFFKDFIQFTPIELELLESYLAAGHIDHFYKSLADLKYLIEFSDNLSRYWFLLRGYSGALAKLKTEQTVKGTKKLYSYYFDKYGDRRILRNEHWLEKRRWDFLDELQAIYSEDELEYFIRKYQQILADNLTVYVSFMMAFIVELKNIQHADILLTES